MLPLCLDQGVGVLPYSPLARGLLARAAERNNPSRTPRAIEEQGTRSRVVDNDHDVVEALRAVAAERAVPPARIVLAWLLDNAAVTAPIIGATRPDHLDDAVAAVGLSLDEKERARLETPYLPHVRYG